MKNTKQQQQHHHRRGRPSDDSSSSSTPMQHAPKVKEAKKGRIMDALLSFNTAATTMMM